ncbi:ABC transporter permease [Clostridium felsineum]|uniref:ABC transporter permease n=1 Tax=Clostridium felsineum TaxID=36839 RepID=UPI00098C8840|nr:ABC transporter permease [Clostridium felsineum]URZ18268.1 hypothetical protein CLFE_043320 [Clostridium felsineum DSM 794]
MRVLHIAYYTFRKKFKASILPIVIFPIILIGILGISLKSEYIGSMNYHENIELFSYNKSVYKDINDFIKNDMFFKDKINMSKVNYIEKGTYDLKNRKCDGYVVIDNNNNIKLYLRETAEGTFNTLIIKNFVHNVTEKLKSKGYKDNSDLAIKKINVVTSSIDYYAVTMLVMITLYGATYGFKVIHEDMNKEIKGRIESLPIKQNNIVFGKMLGLVAMLMVDLVIVCLASKFIYGANLGSNYSVIISVIFLYSLLAISLGMFLQLLFLDIEISNYIIQIVTPIFTILSGGYMRISALGENLTKLSFLSPSYAAQNIIFGSRYGFNLEIKKYYIELIVLDVILVLLISILSRRRLS